MRTRRLMVFLMALTAAGPVAAVQSDPGLVYRIGGAAPVSAPPGTTSSALTLGGSLDWNMGGACGRFDPAQAIQARISNIVRGADRAMSQITDSVVSSAINAPFYLLQQMAPDRFQTLMNGVLQAEESFRFSTRNCQQMQAVIARGGNPYSDWLTVSVGQEWNRQISITGDITEADEAAQEDGPSRGVAWIGGDNAGGDGQQPIRPVRDTARAGYNILLGRDPGNRTVPPANHSPLVQAFAHPDAATQWLAEVIGDQEIRLTGTPSGTPGLGLLPKVESKRTTVYERLSHLIQPGVVPSAQELAAVSAPGVPVTDDVVLALRRLPADSQALLLDRLAAEVATAHVLNQALLARQVLQAGRGETNISAAGPAQRYLNDRALPALDAEIEGLMLQLRARRELVSDNALRILSANIPAPAPAQPAAISSSTVENNQ